MNNFWTPKVRPKETRVDSSSGVAYEEWSLSAELVMSPQQRAKAWLVKSLGRKKNISNRLNAVGASCLQDMALRVLVVNMKELDKTHLQALPLPVLRRLWDVVIRKSVNFCVVLSFCSFFPSQVDSIATWQFFAKSRGTDIVEQGLEQLRLFKAPVIPLNYEGRLTHYIPYMNSSSIDWLTTLTVNDCQPISRADWLAIPKLRNLASLCVESYRSALNFMDDLVIKSWSMAANQGHFLALKVLILYYKQPVRGDILEHLDSMPSLKIVGLRQPISGPPPDLLPVMHLSWSSSASSHICRRLRQVWEHGDQQHKALYLLEAVRSLEGPRGMYDDIPILSATTRREEDVAVRPEHYSRRPTRNTNEILWLEKISIRNDHQDQAPKTGHEAGHEIGPAATKKRSGSFVEGSDSFVRSTKVRSNRTKDTAIMLQDFIR